MCPSLQQNEEVFSSRAGLEEEMLLKIPRFEIGLFYSCLDKKHLNIDSIITWNTDNNVYLGVIV